MTKTPSFLSFVKSDLAQVEDLMRQYTLSDQADLNAAVNLILAAGGKRIRPALTLLTGRMLAAPQAPLYTLAAAIEMLHTATLVHDDLIDGAILRRGMPTLNSKWSPGATVLTGDFCFAAAARLAADACSISVMQKFSQTLSVIVSGEITQLFASRCQVDRKNYDQRIYSKTASLFETSAACAAIISSASSEVVQAMTSYGYHVGMAFQIIDDILDFTGEQATLGKPVGSDLRQGLVTLPALYYIQNHPTDPNLAPLHRNECIQDSEQIERVILAIRESNAIDLAYAEAKQMIDQALKALSVQPACPEKSALEELALFIVERNS